MTLLSRRCHGRTNTAVTHSTENRPAPAAAAGGEVRENAHTHWLAGIEEVEPVQTLESRFKFA